MSYANTKACYFSNKKTNILNMESQPQMNSQIKKIETEEKVQLKLSAFEDKKILLKVNFKTVVHHSALI